MTKYVRGFPVREWIKKASARNEALDCEVYAYAALQNLYMRYNRKTIWEQLEKRIKAPELALPVPAQEQPVEAEAAPDETADNQVQEDIRLPRIKSPASVPTPRRNFTTNF